ncbi:MAG: VWA domain-containing protein, partial [Dehalococcoidales bacterium]
DLEQVNRILLMYGQALAGTKVQIHSTETLSGKSMGWIHHDLPTTDGISIFVPPTAGNYDSERENFDWYKVAVTHQAGHIEFGTYGFSFEKEARLFPDRRRPSSPGWANLADMVRFFNLFGDIKLALDIFAVVEDFRIDHLLKQEYAGIRSIYRWIEQDSLSRRPSLESLPLSEAFIELLIRASLNGEPGPVPGILHNRLRAAMPILKRLQMDGASVEDTAEATIRLYEIINAIPNYRLPEWQRDMPEARSVEILHEEEVPEPEVCESADPDSGLEVPYHAAAEVEFRGSFNPEFVHLLQALQENPDLLGIDPLTLSSEELEIGRILRGEIFTTGMYVTDLPVTANTQETVNEEPNTEMVEPRAARPAVKMQPDEEGESFFYDEWDYQASSYRPRWCRVREKLVAEGNTDFFENTLARNSLLAAQIRKQFEMLAPELLQKLNRLHDGEELDLNAAIEALVDRKAGHIPDEKVYWKRRKIKRDVAVVFLIDMSSSTADVIDDFEEEEDFADWYFARFQALLKSRAERAQQSMQSPRQVIDIAKESMVLMINALEATGDCYGIYGFSGHGRDNVEFLVVKDLDELFSPTVKRRIDRVRPLHSTRMGPAIRHATSKLEVHDAKTKILFLVSDGYPQDEDYGRDNNDKEYALHDTRMALIEAKRKNIIPFCLTIDIAGYDYLKKMAQDIGYEVVNKVESLPERLPILYKRLTS